MRSPARERVARPAARHIYAFLAVVQPIPAAVFRDPLGGSETDSKSTELCSVSNDPATVEAVRVGLQQAAIR